MNVAMLFDSVLLHEMTHSSVVGTPQAVLRLNRTSTGNSTQRIRGPIILLLTGIGLHRGLEAYMERIR